MPRSVAANAGDNLGVLHTMARLGPWLRRLAEGHVPESGGGRDVTSAALDRLGLG